MVVRLKSDAAQVRVKLRRYSEEQAQLLKDKVEELLSFSLVRRNPSSALACAPLIVPKERPEKYIFTTYLPPVKKQTLPLAWPMPDLEAVLARLAGRNCFSTIDLCHGYWKLPLDEALLECQIFM